MAAKIRITKDLFLWSMSVIYLFAFSSLFVQIPGLYGDKGILPAHLTLQNEAESFHDLATNQPTLLRLLPKVGLDVQTGMDFLSLGGIIVSFVAMVSHDFRNSIVFAVLWAFYLSLFQVGQTFFWFQWDLLLLEAGFLAVIVAPFNCFGFHDVADHREHDQITLWLVKWLLFRYTFASGIVKLLSKNATWWSLKALKHHYETQLLPTPVAWVFHQFPDWWHQLAAAGILVNQIIIPLFFFSPSKRQRYFAFYCQVAYVILLILSGNFGFCELLVLTLSLSLTDDGLISKWFHHTSNIEKDHPEKTRSPFRRLNTLEKIFLLLTYAGLIFAIFLSFTFSFHLSPLGVETEIALSPEDLDSVVGYLLPLTIVIGALSLVWTIAKSVFKVTSKKQRSNNEKLFDVAGCAVFGLIAVAIFSISLVPHAAIQKDAKSYLPEQLHDVYSWTAQNYRLTNSYNLLAKSTDEEDGRLEIVIEGSNRLHGNWKEYHFRYKPNDESSKLSVVAPHLPRLDSQMWYAARGRYDQSPWFLNFVYRLLTNQVEVLELIDTNPFTKNPPKYIRAVLYRYKFATKGTKTDKFAGSDWWVREPVREFLPPLTLDEPSFVSYLTDAGIYAEVDAQSDTEDEHNFLYLALETIRSLLGQGSGNVACILLVVSGLILTLVDPGIRLTNEDDRLANGINSHGISGK